MSKRLDSNTEDQILKGHAPDGAPAGYAQVAALMRAAGSPTLPGELGRQAATVKAMAEALQAPSLNGQTVGIPPHREERKSPVHRATRMKLGIAAVAGSLLLVTGLAFAGGLPGAAQDVAHDMLAELGINVPASENAPDEADARGESEGASENGADAGGNGDVGTHVEGEDISSDAQEVDSLEEAADLAETASDGESTTGTDIAESSAEGAGTTDAPAGTDTGSEAAEQREENQDRRGP